MRALVILAALALPLGAHAEPKAGDTLACASKDPARRLTAVVGLVEPYGQSRVAHITLRDEAPGATLGVMAHIPIEVGALTAGCPLAPDAPRPLDSNFRDGLAQWRRAVEAERAGIFTISPDEVFDFVLRSVGPRQ